MAQVGRIQPKPKLPERIRSAFQDPVLRALSAATLINTFGRGAFLTLTVLYFTGIVGLSVGQVALILTIASGVGVATSLAAGHLSDHFSARRIQLIFVVVEAIALMAYSQARSFGMVLAIACVVAGADRASNAARSSIIARAFVGADRVRSRSILRTVTNVGIAVGSSAATIPLLIGTGDAYRIALLIAGCFTAFSATQIARLPRRVDAYPAKSLDDGAAPARGRSPFRDVRYLALTALLGIFALQYGVNEIGMPLWIVHHTSAPIVMVTAVLIINTVLVVLLQIPLSRGTDDIRRAGRVVAWSGGLMVIACALYAAAQFPGTWAAVVLLVFGAVSHTFAEILSSAGGWGLSFELADIRRAGAYQSVFSTGYSLGMMAAPLVVTSTALQLGSTGWGILAGVFLLSSLGVLWICRSAAPHPHSSRGDDR